MHVYHQDLVISAIPFTLHSCQVGTSVVPSGGRDQRDAMRGHDNATTHRAEAVVHGHRQAHAYLRLRGHGLKTTLVTLWLCLDRQPNSDFWPSLLTNQISSEKDLMWKYLMWLVKRPISGRKKIWIGCLSKRSLTNSLSGIICVCVGRALTLQSYPSRMPMK